MSAKYGAVIFWDDGLTVLEADNLVGLLLQTCEVVHTGQESFAVGVTMEGWGAAREKVLADMGAESERDDDAPETMTYEECYDFLACHLEPLPEPETAGVEMNQFNVG